MTDGLEAIAVIGIGCRVPGAATAGELWDLLADGRDATVGLGEEELRAAGVTPDELADPRYVRRAALPGELDGFDAGLFGMTPHAAAACDPQVRLFLEVAHSALEDAGHDPADVGGGCGVFGSTGGSRYRELAGAGTSARTGWLPLESGVDGLAALTSYHLGLHGPSLTTVSAGSSSLVSIHLACQSLRLGECDVALAGGSSVELPLAHGYRWRPGDVRSPAGVCRPLSAAADGTLFGSGAVVVVLKRLDDAVADGDHVRAVVVGSAIGADGRAKAAPAEPSAPGQAAVVNEAMVVAGCSARDISYLEVDGFGSAAADGAEITALTQAYAGLGGAPPASIPVGSVKSNLGHLAWAAGAAALAKVALALDGERIPPTLHVGAPNPRLAVPGVPFAPAGTARAWPRTPGRPRRAAVHAAGMGGANAHLIVEEGPPPAPTPPDGRPRIVVWSGRDRAAADAARARLARHLRGTGDAWFADSVATLQQARTAHPARGAVVCADAGEAAVLLDGDAAAATGAGGPPPVVAFAFPAAPGPADRPGSGLYGVERVFTEAVDEWLEVLEHQGADLAGVWPDGRGGDEVTARLVGFVTALALARTWRSWGVVPAARLSKGAGRIAAAVDAGELLPGPAVRLLRGSGAAGSRPGAAVAAPPAAVTLVLRLGPGGPAAPAGDGRVGLASLPDARGSGEDPAHLARTLAELWVRGAAVRWSAVGSGEPLQRVPLPPYPYQRRRHWLSPPTTDGAPAPAPAEEGPGALAVLGLPPAAVPLAPLGRVQQAFWVLEQLAPGSGVSNIGIAFRTARPLRWWPLQSAVTALLRRHPALRLRIPEVGGVPLAHLTAPDDADLTVVTGTTTEAGLVGDLRSFLHAPFDLRRDFPFRAAHLTTPDGGSVVCLAAHHLAIDAASVQLLVEELGRAHDGLAERGELPSDLRAEATALPEPEPTDESLAHWLDRLRGVDPAGTVLPGARPSPPRPTFAGGTCSIPLSANAQEALAHLRRTLRATDNVIMLGAFCLTLVRHGADPDLVVGVPVGTRDAATRRRVGYGVSTLPLRIGVDLASGFRELVREAEDAFLSGVEHADVTTEVLLAHRGHDAGDWRVPLFRQMFNYRPWTDDDIRICGAPPVYIEDLFDRSRLDLQVIAVPEPGRSTLRAWYSTEVHDEPEVLALLARMQVALERGAEDLDRPLRDLDLSTPVDRAVVAAANRTARAWPGPPTLAGRIRERAGSAPRATALVEGGEAWTRARLLAAGDAVTDRLRAQGVSPGDVVALALSRGAALAAAVLGVWGAGAAYLPLDPRQPAARLRHQVDDAGARAVVTAGGQPDWAGPRPVVAAGPGPHPGPAGPGARPATAPLDPDPDADAYVIHTSGSTGRPKAVRVTHRNLHNVVLDLAARTGLPPGGGVLWSTTPAFDISALELLLPLAAGGCVVVAPEEAAARPRCVLDLLGRHDVRVLQATPTAWRLLLPEVADELAGRVVLCGGEPLSAALARRLLAAGARLLNVYGPTETTIWSTAAEIAGEPADPVSVGLPLANTRVHVLDDDGRDRLVGVPGELWIGGDGVAAGYVRRPELTDQRFVQHPVHGRCYRTGDVARLRRDGQLELLGRRDRQVKLRGHRIELGEVEAVLEEQPDVAAAAVVLAGDPQSDGRLVAFVRPAAQAGDPVGLPADVLDHARALLPAYALPSGIVVVAALPTTANGKVDHRALAVPDAAAAAPSAAAGEAADAPLTAALVGLWREVLERPALGPHDDFFLSGGHSVLAIRLAALAERDIGRPLPVRAVFEHPTPARLAALLARGGG